VEPPVHKRLTRRRAREEASRHRDGAGQQDGAGRRIDEAIRIRSAESDRAFADQLEEWKRRRTAGANTESDG
jgi:hypothetical protein